MKGRLEYIIAVIVIIIALVIVFLPNRGETPIVENDSINESLPAAAAATEVKEKIVGTWVSLDDENYTVRYEQNGKVYEHYEGGSATTTVLADTEGTWTVLVEDGEITVATLFNGEVFAYRVVEFTETEMTLRERSAIRDNHFKKR